MKQLNTNDQHLSALLLAERLGVTELSARKLYIVRMVAWGHPVKQIADQLNLSLHTVRQHLKNIHRELNAHSTSDLTRWHFFRKYGIADNWCKRVIAILLFIISIGSIFEMSCNVMVLRTSSTISSRVARNRSNRRNNAYVLMA